MGYVMLMTFAGSALFGGYLCWKRILAKSVTECMKYRALMIVMVVYTVPWEWLKGIYRQIVGLFLVNEVDLRAKGLVNIADFETRGMDIRTKEYQLLMLVMLIWFMLATLFLLIRVTRFIRKRRTLCALAIKCEDENLEQTLKQVREVVRYRRSLEIVHTRADNNTFTIGTIKPIIFLQKDYDEVELYWILKHEITHIAKRDLWVKLLLEFVCCLHWFNPVVYLLGHEIRHLSETSCDERVIHGCTKEECETYIDLLNKNRGHRKIENLFNSAIKGNQEIDKRIALIRNRKDIKYRDKALAICIFGFLIFLDSLTALAYPKVHHVKDAAIEMAEDAVDGGNFWIYDYAEDGYGTLADVVLYDKQFVDPNGQIYPIDSTASEDSCLKHKVISGMVQIHEKDPEGGEGGCTLETYEGTRCIECGTVWRGILLHKTRKIPCIH